MKNRIQPKGALDTINIEDVIEGKKKLKSSISQSNRHLGHHILLLAADYHNKKEFNKVKKQHHLDNNNQPHQLFYYPIENLTSMGNNRINND